MDKHDMVFEQCRTEDDIHSQIQQLLKELFTTILKQNTHLPTRFAENERFDLNVLPELSYAELKDYTRPVFLLSEMCRLLVKLGTQKSLHHCLALSHTIYAFTCRHHESRYISYLYKGITQIGLKLTDLGIKNVLRGMSEHSDFSVVPVDQALGYWALVSAAILKKNLRLALTYAQKWHNASQKGNLQGEMFRAKMVIHLFHLLLGETETCPRDIKSLVSRAPKEWKGTVDFLEGWTRDATEGWRGNMFSANADILSAFSPYPLFLGIDWRRTPHPHPSTGSGQAPLPEGAREYFEDFSVLCEVRRNFCHAEAIERLSVEKIEDYAHFLARWELPRPLYEFEIILRKKAADKNLQYLMTRLLGKRVFENMIGKRPTDPDVITQNEAIILLMDVRQYSTLSESRTPEEMFDLLNPVFKIMNEELEKAGGMILEFVGDCILIVFNTFPDQQSEMTEILWHTTRCLQRIHILNAMLRQTELPEIQIGVGINKGPVALGYLGGLERCHLAALGNTTNLAARIESSTKALFGDVLASEFCFDGKEPDLWMNPWNVNFSMRDLGKHTMRNMKQPVRLFGLKPLLRYWIDFVPMGFVASPERGVVYLDTGNSDEAGIIDHHFSGQQANSACELLNRKPELLLGHLKHIPVSQIEFRLHNSPDLDCAATLYTAYELMGKNPRSEILWELAEYVSRSDQGIISNSEQLNDSLRGIFIAHQNLAADRYGDHLTDLLLLEAGLRVIDAAFYLMENPELGNDFSTIFQFQPHWFLEERQLIREDTARYDEDVQVRSHTYTARVNGIAEPVPGLWLDHPQSIFYKLWVRSDPTAPEGKGYCFQTIDLSQPAKNRFIIRVDPESGTNLNGLGQLLERHESLKRKKLGQERPIHPIRYPSNNSDPWYFGQGHQYTIIDSPWEGTVLTAEEVQAIHQSWQRSIATGKITT